MSLIKKFCLFIFLLLPAPYLPAQTFEAVNLHIIEEDYNAAIKQLNVIIKNDSSNTDALYKLGLCYLGLNKFTNAVKEFELASQKDEGNPKFKLSLGRAYRNSGNYIKAKEVYSRILISDSLNQQAAVNLAALYADIQDFIKAKDLYLVLNRQDSTNNFYLKQLGLCYFKMDDLKSAAEYYEKALRVYSSDVNASLDLSLIYFKMEKLDSAFITLNKVYGLYGEDARIDKMLGEIHLKRKDYVYADKYFKRALLNGDSSAVLFQKAGIAVYLIGMYNSPPDSAVLANTFTEANVFLQKSYLKNNKDALTALYLGLSFKELHNYPDAIKYIEESLNLAVPPYMSDVYNYLATAYDQNGEYKKALDTYNEALEHNPDNKTIFYYMAYIHDKRLSDQATAIKLYQKFIDCKNADKFLKAYAETRVDKIKEEQFFRNGSSQFK